MEMIRESHRFQIPFPVLVIATNLLKLTSSIYVKKIEKTKHGDSFHLRLRLRQTLTCVNNIFIS